jgi:putative addiction module component (TIGR02574 family)
MTKRQIQQEVLQLSVDEQLELAEAIWDRLEKEPQPTIPEWQKRLLDECIAEDDADLDAGSPWTEVKQRILASL